MVLIDNSPSTISILLFLAPIVAILIGLMVIHDNME